MHARALLSQSFSLQYRFSEIIPAETFFDFNSEVCYYLFLWASGCRPSISRFAASNPNRTLQCAFSSYELLLHVIPTCQWYELKSRSYTVFSSSSSSCQCCPTLATLACPVVFRTDPPLSSKANAISTDHRAPALVTLKSRFYKGIHVVLKRNGIGTESWIRLQCNPEKKSKHGL
jgi:hypothetical protein